MKEHFNVLNAFELERQVLDRVAEMKTYSEVLLGLLLHVVSGDDSLHVELVGPRLDALGFSQTHLASLVTLDYVLED